MRIIIMIMAAALAGCSTPAAVRPPLQALDTGLTRPCADRPRLPPGAATAGISEREAVQIIGGYDAALSDCARRQAALVRIVEDRDNKLGSK